jgi:hypothetical protein
LSTLLARLQQRAAATKSTSAEEEEDLHKLAEWDRALDQFASESPAEAATASSADDNRSPVTLRAMMERTTAASLRTAQNQLERVLNMNKYQRSLRRKVPENAEHKRLRELCRVVPLSALNDMSAKYALRHEPLKAINTTYRELFEWLNQIIKGVQTDLEMLPGERAAKLKLYLFYAKLGLTAFAIILALAVKLYTAGWKMLYWFCGCLGPWRLFFVPSPADFHLFAELRDVVHGIWVAPVQPQQPPQPVDPALL